MLVERVRVPDALAQVADKIVAPLKASAIVLPMVLILVTVLSQADTELIRPDTQISLEKISLPSGTLFTPLLGLKLSVFNFYALAPLIVFVLHWMLLHLHPVDDEPWAKALRSVGTVLAPATLFAMMWRFAPYAHARPDDIPELSVGLGLSYLHAIFLICDTALILYVRLEAIEPGVAPWGSRAELLRRIGLALRAFMQAALLFVVVFVAATIFAALVRSQSDLGKRIVAALSGLTDATAVLVAGVLVGLASWPAFAALRHSGFHTTLLQSVNPDPATPGGASMSVFAVVLTALVASVALPDLGRPLSLAGARLAAAEPSDAIIAALIASPKIGPEKAREKAWEHFGRGLDYTRWRFARASFDGAIMPRITLNEADLSGASLIRADMLRAHLQGTKLSGAVLSEADLHSADLTCANVGPPDLVNCQKQAQALKAGTTEAVADRTNTDPKSVTTGTTDTRTAVRNGPTMNQAILVGATLTLADLSGASLIRADMTDARLQGTWLAGALLSEADLHGADLTCANVQDATNCLKLAQAPKAAPAAAAPNQTNPTPKPTAAASADACTVTRTGPTLNRANLTGATLMRADLGGASLRSVDFTKVKDITGAKFIGADLSDAIFKGPNELKLSDVDFSNTCLCGADLSKVNLENAKLSGAILRNADLSGATLPQNLQGIDFSGANIKGAIFKGEPPNLPDANLTDTVQVDDFKPACNRAAR